MKLARALVWPLVFGIAGCFGGSGPTVSGPVRCERPADGSPSFGCAVVNGNVVGPDGAGLDGISGVVRSSPQCGCRMVAIDVDSLGRFSVTVHRTEARTATPDTATIVVYMGATASKYPRSVTGDPFFDTSSVHLTYAPIGEAAVVYTLGLRIPLPAKIASSRSRCTTAAESSGHPCNVHRRYTHAGIAKDVAPARPNKRLVKGAR